MFGSAGCFGLLLAVIMAWIWWAEREQDRILRDGIRTRAVVVDRNKDRKGTLTLQLRLPEEPKVEPFWRICLDPAAEALKPGDSIDYVYVKGEAEGGVVGPPRHGSVPLFVIAFSVFVAPFLIAGMIIRRRERSSKAAA